MFLCLILYKLADLMNKRHECVPLELKRLLDLLHEILKESINISSSSPFSGKEEAKESHSIIITYISTSRIKIITNDMVVRP